MTEEAFTELVDLYLDGEISESDRRRLWAELAASPRRKQLFLEQRCLHEATRLALTPGESELGRRRKQRTRRSGSASRWSKRSRMSRSTGGEVVRPRARFLPRRALGAAALGGLLMVSVLLTPGFRGSLHPSFFSGFLHLQTPEQSDGLEMFGELRPSDWARYQKLKSRAHEERASLVAQMRLLGLRPELTPVDKQLQYIKASAVQPEEVRVNRAALLSRLQQFEPIPEPKLLRRETVQSEPQWGESRPGGFGVHLTGY